MQSLDEIFTSSGSLKDGSIGVSHAVTPTVGDSKAMMHFKSRLKSCEMRIQILTNELEEAKNVLNSAEKKLTTIESTHGVLHHERKCVVEKMQQLIEERELIDEHIADQLAKLDEVSFL